MKVKIITDPSTISQLRKQYNLGENEPKKNNNESASNKFSAKIIKDPSQIAQLRQQYNLTSPEEQHHWADDLMSGLNKAKDVMDNAAGYATSALSAPLDLFKNFGNVVNEAIGVPQMTFNPESVASQITGHDPSALKGHQELKNITKGILGTTVAPELSEETMGKLIGEPSSTLGSLGKNLTVRGLSQIPGQVAVGAVMTPQDRMQGATAGAVGGAVSSVLGSLLHLGDLATEHFYPKKLTQKAASEAKNLWEKLTDHQKSGYDLITKHGEKLTTQVPSTADKLFGNIFDPSEQMRFFEQDKQRLLNNIPELKDALTADSAAQLSQATSPFDPIDLDYMEKKLTTPGSDLRKTYKNYLANPTLRNADDFKKQLSARSYSEGKAGKSGNRELLNKIKSTLINDVIAPTLDSVEELPNAGEKYKFADRATNSLKNIFDKQELENLGRGRVLNLTPDKVKKALEKSYENGNLSEAPMLASIYKDYLTKKSNPFAAAIANHLNLLGHSKIMGALKDAKLPQIIAQYENLQHPYGF